MSGDENNETEVTLAVVGEKLDNLITLVKEDRQKGVTRDKEITMLKVEQAKMGERMKVRMVALALGEVATAVIAGLAALIR